MMHLSGSGVAHTCDGVSRRDFMQVGSLGAIGLSMADAAAMEARAAESSTKRPGKDQRSCIMIFNLGAPSQLDTFDPKPDAPAEIRGPFKAISTKSPAIQISEIFPRHAAIADKISFVRSCNHGAPAVHDAGWQMMQTGRFFTGGVNTPHAGSVTSYLMGRKTDLPPFVVLPELMGSGGGNLPNGQAGGFLGKAYDPFALNADPSRPDFAVPDLLPPAQLGEVRLQRRQRLRNVVEQSLSGFEQSENAQLIDSSFQSAFRLISSPQAREAFDLNKESPAVRERYGMNRFGQCCLLARRLVEAGVRFVTINTFLTVFNEDTWDIHGTLPFTSIEGMKNIVAPMYDQAYTALIEDLVERGMLDETLVCNLAEFGRTPRVNPAGGRDHWSQCWTVYFAGGGVQGGRVVGRSDPIGGYPAERPVTPPDVVATIYHSLGFNVEEHLPGPAGRPFPLADFGTKPILELF
ncbi:DUF1501 domain-containing protein [Schlesneria sp.]|uniref:DUF1501 domain-containing protein n=1 Tax=Schlesneria sp. TaxID=2762018 RepID=UPI002EFAE3A6